MGFFVGGATSLGTALAAVLGSPAVVCAMSDPRISESSGLVASTLHRGVLWTHNDSGDTSRIFAVGADGRTRSTYRLAVAAARDWETMTSTTDSRGRTLLWVGDIGDNNAVRTKGVLVHRVLEPTTLASSGTLSASSYRLVYDDGPHDAEAMFFGRDGRLRVVTKGLLGGSVFVAPATLSTSSVNVLHATGDAPPLVTDAVELPDGGYALRDYGSVYLYAEDGSLRETDDSPTQPQGESMALSADHRSLLLGSEGRNSEVLRVALPAAVSPAPSSSPVGSASASASRRAGAAAPVAASADEQVNRRLLVATLAVAGLGVVTLVSARRRRRRHQ